MPHSRLLLTKLIKTLIDEWGPERVKITVNEVVADVKLGREVSSPTLLSPSASPGVQRKPNAAEQVEMLQVDGPRRNILLEIAERFDRKQFLPSVADVREFLILSGERPSGIKDRTGGFRTLLQLLRSMPTDRLQNVSDAAKHAGPSQLGPISDAILAAGERIARRREPPAGHSASERAGSDLEADSARKTDAASSQS